MWTPQRDLPRLTSGAICLPQHDSYQSPAVISSYSGSRALEYGSLVFAAGTALCGSGHSIGLYRPILKWPVVCKALTTIGYAG